LFNLGGHALYAGGEADRLFRQYGLKLTGGSPAAKGTAIWNGQLAPLLSELPDADGPGEAYLRKETLSTAYLLLQQLTWAERAVFILREALQYDYEEIAEIVGKSQANCRQIFRRARKAVSGLSERPAASGPGAETLAKRVDQFVAALTGGQPGLLVELLKREAALYSDGGGKVTAAVHPIRGAERIAAFLLGVLGKAPPDFSYRIVQINGQPGIVTSIGARPNSVLTFRMEEDAIAELYLVVNPDKLEHLPQLE
jgi:RNA polymerase sigma-70 factor (ECF subfamily)